MRIKYLETAGRDALWFRQYYGTVFPAGKENAAQSLLNIQHLLKTNPYMGQPVSEMKNIRRLPVPRTPFVLFYRVGEDRIEVLRLRDSRRGSDD